MSKLHELLAVESDLSGTYTHILSETKNTFEKKADHFFGFVQRLEMFDADQEGLEEHKELVTTVADKLTYMNEHIARYFDAVLQKERTNQEARADIVVDGAVLAANVPATFLLGLETKFKAVRDVYTSIPTLTPGIKWEPDNTRENTYRRANSEEKFKTARTFKHKVLYEATDHHPAQIEKWEETENVGKYKRETWCGMLTPGEKSALIGRVNKLIHAIKKARQRANTTEVVGTSIGAELFDFIHTV